MICRTWHGWTRPEDAGAYERIVLHEVIPGIERMALPGFRHIDLLRRDAGPEVEFTTLMWFDDVASVRAFVGEDVTVSHVPAAAREVLSRFDARAVHSTVVERRPQPQRGPALGQGPLASRPS